MSTQRLDLPCRGFSRKEGPRVSLSLEKPGDTRGCCSLRYPITPTSPSLVAQTDPWGGKREEIIESSKIFHDRSFTEEACLDRGKRVRTETTAIQLVGANDDFLFHHCIGEFSAVEDAGGFIPDSTISLPVTSSTNASIGSLGTDKDLGGAGEETSGRTGSYSSSHSGTRSLSHEDLSENERWDRVCCIPFPSGIAGVRGWAEDNQTENQGLELVSLLMLCAESVSSSNHAAANYFLARLGELASPTGSPIHRVIAYFTEALALRVAKLWPQVFSIARPRELADQIYEDDNIAFRVLNHVTPIPKFLHCTMNESLLRAVQGRDRIHIIDFDIKQGLQWPGLLHSLASRPNPPSNVRITGIGEYKQDLQDTGARLVGLAEELNLHLEFHPVVDRLEDLRLWMLHVKERESVAVNCVLQMHKLLYDETGRALMDFLGLIRSTNPEIILVAEKEAENNGPGWETRLANSFKYYSAIFDSLDSSLPDDSLARIKVEEMFAREIRNIVACEGSERIERYENFGKWRRLMEDSGFGCVGIRERETIQSRLLLRMYQADNYSIEKQGGGADGLTLRWSDQPLYTVSTWALVDIAGSSTTSQPG